MSTINVATIGTCTTIKSNSSSPTVFQNSGGTEIGQLCRAWVRFNGTGTPAITDDFFVASITDNGTGDYTINFDSALPSANYAMTGSSDNGTSGAAMPPHIRNATPPTTTAVRVVFANGSGTAIDNAYNSVVIFGD